MAAMQQQQRIASGAISSPADKIIKTESDEMRDSFGYENVFKLITSVSGVGPKLGISILSEFTFDKIMLFIASGDAKSLTAASGVGIKLAQRIILELRDKLKKISGNFVLVL